MKQNLPFLRHILDEIHFLMKETKDLKYEEFMENEVLKRAFPRSLEIIGEAVKNLSFDLRNKYKNVEWKKIAGMRDKIIHYYFGVNWETVWSVIKDRIPELKSKIETILKEVEEDNKETCRNMKTP